MSFFLSPGLELQSFHETGSVAPQELLGGMLQTRQ